MAKANVNFSKDNEYYTPKKTVEYFGQFDYDPATTYEKAKEFNIESYDTIETDGLKADWTRYKKIWINPPFTEKHKFLEKEENDIDLSRFDDFNTYTQFTIKRDKTILNLIEKQEKIIDLMAIAINNYDSQLEINTYKDKEDIIKTFKELVIEYFEKEGK